MKKWTSKKKRGFNRIWKHDKQRKPPCSFVSYSHTSQIESERDSQIEKERLAMTMMQAYFNHPYMPMIKVIKLNANLNQSKN